MFCCKKNKFVAFSHYFCVKVEGNKGQTKLFTFNSIYLQGIFRVFHKKFCISMYYLEIRAICRNYNFGKIYIFFGVNSVLPEVVDV